MSEIRQVPLRSELPEELTWNLTDLYPSDEAFLAELNAAKEDLDRLAAFQGHLGESARTLLALLKLEDELTLRYDPLMNYPSLHLDENTGNSAAQEMRDQAYAHYTAVCTAAAFEIPEILAIPDETLERFYKEEPGLETYRVWLDRQRSRRAHTLSDGEERLLALAGDMSSIPDNVFSMLANADMTFPDAADSEGIAHPVSHASFIPLQKSQDRVLRKNAYEALYSSYLSHINTLAATLNGQIRQLQFFARARRYDSTMQAALTPREVPESVYLNLIQSVHENLPAFHRYVELRRRCLGLDKLHMYDMYVPVVKNFDWSFTFEEAKETVLNALAPLGEEYISLLKKGFDSRWIDVCENKGKRSGAYSCGCRVHPYVLTNFQGTLNDVFTLAHEMGHALHSYLSHHTQPVIYSRYVIFVAEVASTCNEALLMQYLLKTTDDPTKRRFLLNYFLEQFRSTLYRQTMFAEFELEANRMAERGEGLSADSLSRVYGDLNRLYFGENVITDEKISAEWARIPHFYYNYYVFQYATGYSAAIALSTGILKEGEPAVKRYLGFLSGGSSKTPIELLKGAGVDMSTPAPVNQALKLFDSLVTEMEELMK